MAFHINLRETKTKTKEAPAFFDGCSLIFNNGKPSLSCELFESVKLDIDLTCSICLIGDIPDAEIKPPENVLFACKLNPVTEDDTIFSRFGTVTSNNPGFQNWRQFMLYAFIVGSKFIIGIDIIVFLHVVNTECMNSELPVNPPPPSEWLEDTLIKLYLSGYSKHVMDADCDTRTTSDERMPEETICRDSLSFSVDGTGNDDARELEGGEWIPDENDSSNNVLDEGAYQDEENWRAQYGQVIKPTKESVTDF